MERRIINQQTISIGGGNIETPKPFYVGEVIKRIYPHNGSNGHLHKGNMKIISTDGTFSDSGLSGHTARAKCVMLNCNVTIEVMASE